MEGTVRDVRCGVIYVEISGVVATEFVRLYNRTIQIAKPINPVKAMMVQPMVKVKTNVLVFLTTTRIHSQSKR